MEKLQRDFVGKISINPNELETVICPNCGSDIFEFGYKLKKIPPLLSPTGREELLVFEVFLCKSCKAELGSILLKSEAKNLQA